MAFSAALVEMTEPASLARLATETGSVPLSTRLLLKVVQTVNGFALRADGTINRRLADLVEYKVPADEAPDSRGISSKDIVINPETGLWVRVYSPQVKVSDDARGVIAAEAKGKQRHVIFHFHGGGFAVLSADGFIYDVFCRRLCRRSEAIVISVNYRRAPEHRYPVAYDDCYASLEWLEGFSGDLFKPHKLDLSRCVLMGDSAGGNIVHHIGSRWAARSESAFGQLKVVAHVLLFPFFGSEERMPSELRGNSPLVSVESMDWYWRAYLPLGSNRDHPASNVLGPNAPDVSSLLLPPTLVTVAEYDMLKDWQLRYAKGLAHAAKPVRLLYYVGGVHCLHILTTGKLVSDMFTDILSFINDVIGKQSTDAGK